MNRFKELFGMHKRPDPEITTDPESETEAVEGDRGVASVNKTRSIQSRMSNLLAMGLIAALGLGMLSWYYSQAWARQKAVKEEAHKAVKASATGDMALPPLGKVEGPAVASIPSDPAGAPPLPMPPVSAQPAVYAPGGAPGAVGMTRATDHRLDGPVFQSMAAGAPNALPTPIGQVTGNGPPAAASSDGGMESLLKPSVATAVRAKVLSNQPLLLPKGAFIDCTLETAIDSSLPGLTTCVTATDTFGADGKVVLLERGTKLVGETKGDVRQGTARIFVVWSEARTPAGVVVPLASPGTDELGRSGLPGSVDRHFMDRFGAALLISVIEGAVQAAAQPKGGGAVIYNPSAATDVVTEVLKSTVNVPPTVRKQNGDRIQILVARDLDFRSVYELHAHE
jgi:type IV secretion system protein VirB10